jgi:hypothetical protein
VNTPGQRHTENTVTRILGAYPSRLRADVEATLRVIAPSATEPSRDDIGPIIVGGETLRIPYRVYFTEPNASSALKLSPLQQALLATLFTRHHHGVLRERWIARILDHDAEWVPPFVLQLLGEYVIQIIRNLAENEASLKTERYMIFIQENPRFASLTSRRILSYWNCYFRGFAPRYKDHVGYLLAQNIGLWTNDSAKK